jgi:transcriptional regulator GlxA family with amidase domain
MRCEAANASPPAIPVTKMATSIAARPRTCSATGVSRMSKRRMVNSFAALPPMFGNMVVRARLGCDYIVSNIGRPIEVAALAEIAGRSPFHFSRVFRRSIGISPHRYIVHLRLQRALDLARSGQAGLSEIAIRTGFADQSHLWRWVRRVHGVSLTQLITRPASEQQESS